MDLEGARGIEQISKSLNNTKKHLNNFEEVNKWLMDSSYFKYELVKIINVNSEKFRDYKISKDGWIGINTGDAK